MKADIKAEDAKALLNLTLVAFDSGPVMCGCGCVGVNTN
jgi:hypothetical protein